ncbi:MAG: glycerol kinase GlpK [Myxococcales bacterium]|nr:glycerol kinase GlpK [Myxococcales bacterium]
MRNLVMAIDQGTTGSRAFILDAQMNVLGIGYAEFPQHFPTPGWVEHNPDEIWESVRKVIPLALHKAGVGADRIAAIGITNQRETVVAWDRHTGKAYHNAIVWQCRRTAEMCNVMKERGLEETFQEKTGLLLDPYFSGTKLAWLLENVTAFAKAAEKGDAIVGTMDTYITWKLTGGRTHVTDVSNASRTLLMNLHDLEWDEELLDILNIPAGVLPAIKSSSEVYGETQGMAELPDGIPVAGMAGDQQAALFGQACFEPGMAKCTYGTGSFMLWNTGAKPVPSRNRLLTTVAWKLGDTVNYALEGSCFISGAAVQWLRDGLQIIQKSSEIEALAAQVPDTGGVVFVPALVGLGAPHWNAAAKGVLWGLTRGTNRAHIARATLQAIALQNFDVLKAMEADAGSKLALMRVDGGASANNLMMQFQADILGCDISRPAMVETTALGAALLAGLAVGLWPSKDEVTAKWREERRFKPQMSADHVHEHIRLWNEALGRV